MLRSILLYLSMGAVLLAPLTAADATNYYLAPGGSDGNSGTSTAQPWGTLQSAGTRISAGDTLFIMGGTYSNAQYLQDEGGRLRGTASAPIVFKAYGDSPAVFVSTGPNPLGRWYRDYFMFTSGSSDYIVIDGFGSLPPYSPLYLRFEGHEETHNLIRFSGSSSNYCEHITVRGVEIDGGHTSAFAGTGADDVAVGLVVEYCRMSEFTDNYIHHIHHPTGPIAPGDGTERVQGSGHGIYVYSAELCLIQGNRIERCNHGAMEIEIQRPSGHPARYMRIIGNVIEQHYGGGIYMPFNAHHNLVENNIITHCGETTDFGKPGIQLSGSENTVRGNVIYNPMNQPLRLEAQTAIGFNYITDNNLIYNNTFFGSRYNLGILVKNISDPNCSAEGNLFANNILYRSTGQVEDSGGREAEMTIDLYGANDQHNWCDPNANGCLPNGTHWGGNAFLNNLIRRNAEGGDYPRLVLWARDATYGGGWTEWSLPELSANDPTAWSGNIGLDPIIRSEDPDGYGLTNGWWRLSEGSPAIDAGVPVNDNLGAYVESLYPGYGWSNRPYGGAAPDMGAYEFNGEDPSPLSGPNINILPGNGH
jgi:hypothetical protein